MGRLQDKLLKYQEIVLYVIVKRDRSVVNVYTLGSRNKTKELELYPLNNIRLLTGGNTTNIVLKYI